MVEITGRVDSLGFNEFPKTVETVLSQLELPDERNRLRIGTVLTFSLLESRKAKYFKYTVDELNDGRQVFLLRPAWLNKGYDFKVCVEGWDSSANPSPKHDDIYSDLYWKRKHDNIVSFEALCDAVFDIHQCDSPEAVLEEYRDEFEFTVGRIPEALLKPLPWLFIEQDIRYWNYEGRDRTIGRVRDLHNGMSLSKLEWEPQELEDIHETPLAIPE